MNNNSNELHDKAMLAYNDAIFAKKSYDFTNYFANLESAYLLEKEAAYQIIERDDLEPSRTLLLQGAAAIAFELGLLDDAEQLIIQALSFNKFDSLKDELRNSYSNIIHKLAMKQQLIEIQENDLFANFEGPQAISGMISAEILKNKLEYIETLYYRTLARNLQLSFDEGTARMGVMKKRYPLYARLGNVASYTVIFSFGKQIALFYDIDNVVKEIKDCILLYNDFDLKGIERYVGDEDYYYNLIGLLNKIAPDGIDINHVDIGCKINREEISIRINQQKDNYVNYLREIDKSEKVNITGWLLSADDTTKNPKIEVKQNDGIKRVVLVKKGEMEDIVKPYWGKWVTVEARKIRQKYYYIDINEGMRKEENAEANDY